MIGKANKYCRYELLTSAAACFVWLGDVGMAPDGLRFQSRTSHFQPDAQQWADPVIR